MRNKPNLKPGDEVIVNFGRKLGDGPEKDKRAVINSEPSWGWDMFDSRCWTMSLKYEDGTTSFSNPTWALKRVDGQPIFS